MVYCPFCKRKLETPESPEFCIYCGLKLDRETQVSVPNTDSSHKKELKKPTPSYRPWLVITAGFGMIIIFFFFSIIIGSLLLNFFLGSSLGSGIEIHSDSDFKEYISSGSGTINDPYILSNYTLTGQYYGFSIQYTTKHFVITNCTLEICYEGIHIEDVAPGTAQIKNNLITYIDCRVLETGPNCGIRILSSPKVTIIDNTIKNAGIDGIVIENSPKCYLANNIIIGQRSGVNLEYSDSSVIVNNVFSQNTEAFSCFSSHFVNVSNNEYYDNEVSCISVLGSNFARITENTCFNNTWPTSSTSGIVFDTCDKCAVYANTIIKCYRGISISSSNNCTIFANQIENNSKEGISVASGYTNVIYHNTFQNNNPTEMSQASDDGSNNSWFNPELKEGNYWSNWDGTGVYLILGLANSTDLYPLIDPLV